MSNGSDSTPGASPRDAERDRGGGERVTRKSLKREAFLSRLFPKEVMRPTLGRYDVLEFVGEGGMGTVFAAYDAQLDRRVAIKLLKNAARADPERKARLLREAKALARLSHANVVTVHEVWEERGEIHIAMEFIQGEDLAHWQQGPKPWREVLEVYRQAGAGLAAVHLAGMVYRDFKPHNAIRRDDDGVVKLLDFGLARTDDQGVTPDEPLSVDHGEPSSGADEHLTRPGAIVGTPAYMAPEQLAGRPTDARSDQFSYAVSLWEALYGQRPFVREQAVLSGELQERPLSLEQEHGVPGWVRRVLERGLSRDPAERYPSMDALLRDLGRDPAVRRRRIVGALVVAGVTVGGGLTLAELRSEPSCVAVGSMWQPSRREDVHRGMLDAGGPTTPQTWALLSPRLDDYARRHADARQEACEGHRRGLVPDEHYALQIECLDRAEAGFTELADLLARGDASALSNANKAVADLPSASSCGDIERIAAELPPPDDPAVATRVTELREELARASTEESAGLFEEAAQRATTVLQEAEQIDYPPLRAEALMRRGSARMQRDDVEAMGDLDGALWTSLSIEQRAVAAEAAAKRIFVRVNLIDHRADMSEEIELARSLVRRSGVVDWRTHWALANNIGVVHSRQERPDESLSAYEEALRQLPEDGDRGVYERSVTSINMARMLMRNGRGGDAVDTIARGVQQSASLFGDSHPRVLQFRLEEARIHRQLGHYTVAREIVSDVLERSKEDPPSPWTVMEAVQIAWRQGDFETAQQWAREARSRVVDDGPRSATALRYLRQLEVAIAASAGEAGVLERLDDEGLGLEPYERAGILIDLGEGERAEESLEALLETDLPPLLQSMASLQLGRALVLQQRWPEAHQRLSALFEATERNHFDPRAQAWLLLALAEAEAGQGHVDRARARIGEALDVLGDFDADSVVMDDALAVQERIERSPLEPAEAR